MNLHLSFALIIAELLLAGYIIKTAPASVEAGLSIIQETLL